MTISPEDYFPEDTEDHLDPIDVWDDEDECPDDEGDGWDDGHEPRELEDLNHEEGPPF